jgi:hypothetical protein
VYIQINLIGNAIVDSERERETINPIFPKKYEHPQAADWTPQQTASQTPERTIYPIGLALEHNSAEAKASTVVINDCCYQPI